MCFWDIFSSLIKYQHTKDKKHFCYFCYYYYYYYQKDKNCAQAFKIVWLICGENMLSQLGILKCLWKIILGKFHGLKCTVFW